MSLTGWIIVVLSCLLVLAGSVAYGYRADAKATEATVAPLRQAVADANRIAKGHRKAREACSLEMARARKENERALERLKADMEKAEASAEDYQRRLASPLPDDCRQITEAKVCRALMDY